MAADKIGEKALGKGSQGSLFPEQVKSGKEKSPQQLVSIPAENSTRPAVEHLRIGSPVVFHGDYKKIRDADLYRGSLKLDNPADAAQYDPRRVVTVGENTGKKSQTTHVLREVYSPIISLAEEVGMIDYDQGRHKNTLKYVVILDVYFHDFIEKYDNEYGPPSACKFMPSSEFFTSLCQAKVEKYFSDNNKPIRVLLHGSRIHVGDYAEKEKDDLYDDAVEIGLVPMYDLSGHEDGAKYIVCKKDDSCKYAGYRCELITATEFRALVSYALWMQPTTKKSKFFDEGDRMIDSKKSISVSTQHRLSSVATVCFTGFPDNEKEKLEQIARDVGLRPVENVSKRLGALIVGGPGAGQKKLRLAKENNVKVISRETFTEAIEKDISLIDIESMPPAVDAVRLREQLHLPPGIFVAIDFETADNKHDSACAIGLVRIEDGIVTAEEHRLIRPPREKVLNTRIHGLDWKCLQSEPDFSRVWREVSGIFNGAGYLVAHHAVFDRSVMQASCTAHSIQPPQVPFLCTQRGAKATVQVASYSLIDLCEHFSIPFGQHHHALSDAKAALKLWERLHEKGVTIDTMRIPAATLSGTPMPKPQTLSSEEDAVKEFRAIAKALICDEILNQKEFEYLCKWLTKHDHLTESPVVSQIFDLAAGILEDGVITHSELDEMLRMLETYSS